MNTRQYNRLLFKFKQIMFCFYFIDPDAMQICYLLEIKKKKKMWI